MTTTAARAADVQARIFFLLLLRLPPAGVVAPGGAWPSAGPAASSGRGSGVSLGSGPEASPCGGPGASPCGGLGASPCGGLGASPCGGPGASPCGGLGASPCGGLGASPCGGLGASPCGGPGTSLWAGPGGSSRDGPGTSLWGGPGPSSWGDPGFSGSAGSMVSPRAQISPSVRQLKRGSVKPQPMPVSPPHSYSVRNNAATASKFQSCQHHADHQSRRSHRTHYPESLPRKHASVPGRRSRCPALIVPNTPYRTALRRCF